MGKKVFVDADGKAVGEGSGEAAYVFNEGDARLDKFRAARSGKAPAAKPAPTLDDSVERVAKK